MKTEEQALSEGASVKSESPTRDSRGVPVEPDEDKGALPTLQNSHSAGVVRSKPPRNWRPLTNILVLLTVLMATVPAMLSLYSRWVATERVDGNLMIVETGVEEFHPNSVWLPSEDIKGWYESGEPVRFVPPVPCSQPDIRVSISSMDLGGVSRLDVAAPDEKRTRDGFELVARTWA